MPCNSGEHFFLIKMAKNSCPFLISLIFAALSSAVAGIGGLPTCGLSTTDTEEAEGTGSASLAAAKLSHH